MSTPALNSSGWGITLNALLNQLITNGTMIVVSGGTVDLDNAQPNGFLVGYRVTATTIIEGASFAPGSYIFERDTSTGSGWTYRTLAASTAIAVGADVTSPIAGTLAGSAITGTGFTLTASGASDAVALHATPYAFSTDNGVTFSAYQASNVFAVTGRIASTAYQCVHRVRDAAVNVATGSAITVTTTAAWSPASLPGQLARYTAQVPGGYVESAGVISQLTDMSGAGRHLTQATLANRPDLVTTSLNGYPVAQFALADSIASGAAAFSDTGSFVLWGIIRKDGESAGDVIPVRATAGSGHSGGYGWASPSNTNGMLAKMDYTTTAIAHVVTGTHADVFAIVLEGGSLNQRLGSFDSAMDGLALGRPIVQFSLGLAAFSVAECGVLDGPISAGDWTSLRDYAVARYGVH